MSDYKVSVDLKPIVEAMESVADVISGVLEVVKNPRPQREAQELRDLAREHDLDVVQRGKCRVEREPHALNVYWDDEWLTRYKARVDQ